MADAGLYCLAVSATYSGNGSKSLGSDACKADEIILRRGTLSDVLSRSSTYAYLFRSYISDRVKVYKNSISKQWGGHEYRVTNHC